MSLTGTVGIHRIAHDLQSWTRHDWTGGVDLRALTGLEQFIVRTRNTRYELTVLTPATGEVMIRGGRLFPGHTRLLLAGCSMGGSFLKTRALFVGFLMELLHDRQRIVTTRICDIEPVTPRSA